MEFLHDSAIFTLYVLHMQISSPVVKFCLQDIAKAEGILAPMTILLKDVEEKSSFTFI
jgi:hypothetical protein